jgi:hypothetical protein
MVERAWDDGKQISAVANHLFDYQLGINVIQNLGAYTVQYHFVIYGFSLAEGQCKGRPIWEQGYRPSFLTLRSMIGLLLSDRSVYHISLGSSLLPSPGYYKAVWIDRSSARQASANDLSGSVSAPSRSNARSCSNERFDQGLPPLAAVRPCHNSLARFAV